MIPMTRTKNSIVDKHYEDVVNLVKNLSHPSMCATEVSERAREAFGFLSTPQGPLVILGKNEVDKARRASILEAILRGPKYRFIIDHYRQLDKLMLNPDIEFKGWINAALMVHIADDFHAIRIGKLLHACMFGTKGIEPDYSWARMTPLWGPAALHRGAPFPAHDDVH